MRVLWGMRTSDLAAQLSACSGATIAALALSHHLH